MIALVFDDCWVIQRVRNIEATTLIFSIPGSLKRFRFSLYASHKPDTDQTLSIIPGFRDFASRIDEIFLDHLENVTHLSFGAKNSAPLLFTGLRALPLILTPDQMPLLRKLDLKSIFLCGGVLAFIVGHIRTLEFLSLRSAYCRVHRTGTTVDFEWHHFFSGIVDADPQYLRAMDLGWSRESSYSNETDEETDEEEDEVQELERIRKEGPFREIFRYAIIYENENIWEGRSDDEVDVNRRRFLRGDDQEAFERVQRIIDGNAVRYKNTGKDTTSRWP